MWENNIRTTQNRTKKKPKRYKINGRNGGEKMTAKIETSGMQVNMPVKYIRAYTYVRVSTNKQLDF